MHEGERPVGVVGDPPTDLEVALGDVDARVRRGDVASVLADDPQLVVAVGEHAALAVARAGPDAPVLPVDAGRGVRAVPGESLADAVRHALAGESATERVPVLRVEHDGEPVGRAVADVALLAAEVAHISEYAVTANGEHVAGFRADGVVVATPVGSFGYARRVGSPVVFPETGVGTVTPIAPFATDPDHWVVPLVDVRLTVERDETAVALLVDDEEVATVPSGEPIRITPDGSAAIAVVPESRARFP